MLNRKIFISMMPLVFLVVGASSHSAPLSQFVPYCESQLEIPTGEITGFDCNTGVLIPVDPNCEKHSFLTGNCEANSRLGKLTFSNPDVSAVWICRENNYSIGQPGFDDVNMIVNNRKSGKTCFFQARLGGWQPDMSYYNIPEQLPDPRTDNNEEVWLSPENTASIECTSCHSNDPYIVSSYLAESFAEIGMMHFVDPKGPYSVVGAAFSSMNDAISQVESCAGSCHFKASDVPIPHDLTMSEDAIIKQWMPAELHSPYYKYVREMDEPFVAASSSSGSQYKNFSQSENDWIVVEDNALHQNNTMALAAGKTKLYRATGTGSIWRHSGKTACSDTKCFGWQKIGNGLNSGIVRLYANDNLVVRQLFDGSLWSYSGNSVCQGNDCPTWAKIDNNVNIIYQDNIKVAGSYVYQLNSLNTSRGLARHNGSSSCSGSSCPGWQKLDNFNSVVSYAADGNNLYAVRRMPNSSGNLRLGVWRFTGAACSGNNCNGWQLIDNNQNVTQIIAGGSALYQRRSNNTLWRYTGAACSGNSCPGWEQIDSDGGILRLQASGSDQLYKLRNDKSLWRFVGHSCSGRTCSKNWELMDASNSIVELYTKTE